MTPKWNVCNTDPANLESFWLLAYRFMARNKLRPNEFLEMFTRARRQQSGATWHEFDYAAFAPWVGHTSESIRYTLPGRWDVDQDEELYGGAKYCPECAVHGYHSVFHQIRWIHYCLIHGILLSHQCSTCRQFFSRYTRGMWGACPRTFPCGHEWTRADLRGSGDLDLSNVWRLADWLLRVGARNSGERWYAVALDAWDDHDRIKPDYDSFVDLVMALQPLPQEIRNVVRPQWMQREIKMLAAMALPTDWFNEGIRRIRRNSLAVPVEPGVQMFWCGRQILRHRMLRKVSVDAFRDGIRGSLRVLDMSTRTRVTQCWPDSLIDLVAAVFLRKLGTWGGRLELFTEQYIEFTQVGLRFSTQPLGLLRRMHRDDEFYWM